MRDDGKRNVLGVLVDAVDFEGAVLRILNAARQNQPLAVTALAVHGVMTGVLDRAHGQRLNRFGLITPDGQPVRWALNLLHGVKLKERVFGPGLMLRVCEQAAEEGLPIYLYGSTEKMLGELAASLQQRFPKLQICGTRPSLFRAMTAEEINEVAATVRASGAKIVFVGLGCPRQEVFTHEMTPRFSVPTLAVGAAFAFHSGNLDLAPRWMQDCGLEWFYRLWHEPIRLWRRYLLLNPLYCWLVACQWLRLKDFTPRDAAPQVDQPVWG